MYCTLNSLQSDFADNFPEDDMFWHVSVQDMEEMDSVCVEWKNDLVVAQRKVKDVALTVQKKIEELDIAMKEYKEQQKTPCDRQCDMGVYVINYNYDCNNTHTPQYVYQFVSEKNAYKRSMELVLCILL